jgi:lipopolysaccharide biosynthesis protein
MDPNSQEKVKEARRLARAIAFYLPQYHPIPENDEWWGRGFTEWTNTAKAKPMFRGHYQPHIPADLGFYDLRVAETRIAQAELAREYGVEAFCYYHYWFAGKRILERPFDEVLKTKKPDFPFCLCWANASWTGIWHGCPNRTLIEQTYPGYEDHERHLAFLLEAFHDARYVTVDGKPLFLIYWPSEIPEVDKVMEFWREKAERSGLKGLYLVGYTWDGSWVPEKHGFDGAMVERLPPRRPGCSRRNKPFEWLVTQYKIKTGKPSVYSYEKVLPELLSDNHSSGREYPCVIPNWDNTPRSGKNGLVLHGSTPELFRIHVKKALKIVEHLRPDHRLIFVKSWNEWAEGNHLEPDLRFGRAYLRVLREEILEALVS